MSNITVTGSPFQEVASPPWTYDEEGFQNWVHEVLLDCGKAGPYPELGEAIEIAECAGYTIEHTRIS